MNSLLLFFKGIGKFTKMLPLFSPPLTLRGKYEIFPENDLVVDPVKKTPAAGRAGEVLYRLLS